ncbi:HSF-type DNA-binding-domain-containing protein [Thamnidium elegans]|uniref:HSF-type DNA-binding domain-containing protein n=1 Tax=Thamnidium elegans TaxID=101142 RepID=A0A8H7SM31_9FUNG|nr:hypothetical protein INT48_001926 [Thamnidium elegans]KAI8082146.1 HSF-type DNA-binding-domain-containing protein [Thamnidium elegans]
MSGIDSLHISTPGSDHIVEPYSPYINRNKRTSFSSSRSGASTSSPYEPPADFLSFNEEKAPAQRRSSKKGVSSFISKLHTMVEDGRHRNLISWNPHGTSFFVYNAVQFSQEVLPEYFKHSNFSSFVRLLNMYGFHKINKSPRGQRGNNENEIWEFSHPKFQHGRPDFLKDIKRKAMDSELLRRETGDIHASFATLQMSQADLLQQFYVLQDNFSNLLQGFEETKRIQQQQQFIIRQLAERQGLSHQDLLNGEFNLEENRSNILDQSFNEQRADTQSPVPVFVTTPATTDNSYSHLQFINENQNWEAIQNPLQSAPDVTMSIYAPSNTPSPAPVSPNMFDTAVNTPLPPSPMPMTGSPAVPMAEDSNDSRYQLKFEDVNTLGLGFS